MSKKRVDWVDFTRCHDSAAESEILALGAVADAVTKIFTTRYAR